jgi:hypothetical protein
MKPLQFAIPFPPSKSAPAARFPTAADAVAAIDAAPGLTEARRRTLKATVRILARVYRRQLPLIAMDPGELAKDFLDASAFGLGVKESSLAAYKSNMRTVLNLLGLIDTPRRQALLVTPDWAALREALPEQHLSNRLLAFIRYCSDTGVAPEQVSDSTLLIYLDVLKTRRLARSPAETVRRIVTTWAWVQERVPAWPRTVLSRPSLSKSYSLPLTAYPACLQAEIETLLARMRPQTGGSLFAGNRSRRPWSDATIVVRLKGIRLALAALVADGMAPGDITSLAILVEVENAQKIIDWHWRRAAENVTDHLGTIADILRILAKYHVCLTGTVLEEVVACTRMGKPPRRQRMTPKVERRLMQFDDPDNEAIMIHAPHPVMAEAYRLKEAGDLREAAWMAGIALGIAIELRCPMRLKNLTALQLGSQIIKLDTRARTWTHILIEPADIKNDNPLNWPIDPELGSMIDIYVKEFRGHLGHSQSRYLFPHRDDPTRPRDAGSFGQAISGAIHRFLGLTMTPHNFRAFAGWQILRNNPGALEDLRLILGHKTMATTMAFYASFRPQWAAARYNQLFAANQARTKGRAVAALSRAKTPQRRATPKQMGA